MDRKLSRRRRLQAILLALSLAGAQWLLGAAPSPGSLCGVGAGACPVREQNAKTPSLAP